MNRATRLIPQILGWRESAAGIWARYLGDRLSDYTQDRQAPGQNLCCSMLIIIIVVAIAAQPACESIDCERAGSSVFGAHRHDDPSAPYDQNVGPPVGHQLLLDLFFGHRPAALDEYRSPVALRRRDH